MEVLHRWHEQLWSAALAARSHTERARDRRGVGRGDRKFARSLGLRARVCLRVNHRLGGLDWGFDMIVRSALLISAATVLIAGTARRLAEQRALPSWAAGEFFAKRAARLAIRPAKD